MCFFLIQIARMLKLLLLLAEGMPHIHLIAFEARVSGMDSIWIHDHFPTKSIQTSSDTKSTQLATKIFTTLIKQVSNHHLLRCYLLTQVQRRFPFSSRRFGAFRWPPRWQKMVWPPWGLLWRDPTGPWRVVEETQGERLDILEKHSQEVWNLEVFVYG